MGIMTPISPPANIDNPGGDDATDDTAMDDQTGPPPDDGNTPDQSFTLSPQMAAAAGLGDLKVGDSALVTVKFTVTDATDGTITADIEDAMNGAKSAGDAAQAPPKRKPQSRVVGPVEAGFGDDSGAPGI